MYMCYLHFRQLVVRVIHGAGFPPMWLLELESLHIEEAHGMACSRIFYYAGISNSTIVSNPLCLLLGQAFHLTTLQLKKEGRIQDLHEILEKFDVTML